MIKYQPASLTSSAQLKLFQHNTTTMICRSCLRKGASSIRPSIFSRSFTTTIPRLDAPTAAPSSSPPAATSTSAAQPFSTPLSPTPNDVSLGTSLKPKPKTTSALPASICPPGSVLKGLNYFKGKEDPIALADEEYPEWLWHVLDVKEKAGTVVDEAGDEFSKSKKLRRKAAKRQRKLEAKLLASGDVSALTPKVPITKQSVDLPSGEKGMGERSELKKAMRQERRAKIKENNYLKGM
ncbi:54S ribosomal protein L37, mitochondrial [Lachnellula cervina]|uniref:Large ribosomal subunit protein mL54 n=1 Tax=Lachnellula cervina TaxID=1316786 RepID=A0A7D8Z784_9HELO|nr:54S ribosomal protein L37, mitochondrial [Lachnellula cervina]